MVYRRDNQDSFKLSDMDKSEFSESVKASDLEQLLFKDERN